MNWYFSNFFILTLHEAFGLGHKLGPKLGHKILSIELPPRSLPGAVVRCIDVFTIKSAVYLSSSFVLQTTTANWAKIFFSIKRLSTTDRTLENVEHG